VTLLVVLAAAALVVVLTVLVSRRANARADRRLDAVVRRLDEHLTPLVQTLEQAVERSAAARERGVEDHEVVPGFEELQRDELTGLRNRRGYEAELEREIDKARRTGRPLSVVLLDLDAPSEIGSRSRDPETERLLREFAMLLLRLTRATDTVCRCGGDEFGVVLPATTAEGARRFQGRVREEVASSTFGPAGQVTFSVGLVEWQPNETSDSLDARVAAAVGSAEASAANGVQMLDDRRGGGPDDELRTPRTR
jgi:diguanylate cyclase (GGDEF)-like protein